MSEEHTISPMSKPTKIWLGVLIFINAILFFGVLSSHAIDKFKGKDILKFDKQLIDSTMTENEYHANILYGKLEYMQKQLDEIQNTISHIR